MGGTVSQRAPTGRPAGTKLLVLSRKCRRASASKKHICLPTSHTGRARERHEHRALAAERGQIWFHQGKAKMGARGWLQKSVGVTLPIVEPTKPAHINQGRGDRRGLRASLLPSSQAFCSALSSQGHRGSVSLFPIAVGGVGAKQQRQKALGQRNGSFGWESELNKGFRAGFMEVSSSRE